MSPSRSFRQSYRPEPVSGGIRAALDFVVKLGAVLAVFGGMVALLLYGSGLA